MGPNYLWHVDGYDKLKHCRFPIHGAIDGYSRKVLWLKVASANDNPKIVAVHYLECLKELKLVPRQLRSDWGSENTLIYGIQRVLRRNSNDSVSGRRSFLYGYLTGNHRSAALWSVFRKHV